MQGFATLMTVLVLLIVVGLLLTVALRMGASSVSDSAAQSDHIEALFLAESGLERVAQRYTGTVMCNGGLEEGRIALGRGTFEVLPTPTIVGIVCRLQIVGRVGAAARTIETDISGGGAGIAIDQDSDDDEGNRRVVSWNHRVSGANRLLIVGVSFRRNPATQVVTAVTYDGVPLVRVGSAEQSATRVEQWYLVAPPTGTNTVRVTLNGANTDIVTGAVSLTGVDQAFPVSGSAFNTGTSNTASVTVITNTDDARVIDTLSKANNNTASEVGQQTHWNVSSGGGGIRGTGSSRGPISPMGPVTMSWSLNSSQDWAIGALAIRPAQTAQAITWREVVN